MQLRRVPVRLRCVTAGLLAGKHACWLAKRDARCWENDISFCYLVPWAIVA